MTTKTEKIDPEFSRRMANNMTLEQLTNDLVTELIGVELSEKAQLTLKALCIKAKKKVVMIPTDTGVRLYLFEIEIERDGKMIAKLLEGGYKTSWGDDTGETYEFVLRNNLWFEVNDSQNDWKRFDVVQ